MEAGGYGENIARRRAHPYTRQLAEASYHVPTRTSPPVSAKTSVKTGASPLLAVKQLTSQYPTKRRSLFRKSPPFRAVDVRCLLTFMQAKAWPWWVNRAVENRRSPKTLLRLHQPASGEIRF